MVSSILAIIIFIFSINIPTFLSSTFEMVGSITSPLAMMLIGCSLARLPIKNIFNEYKLYPLHLNKTNCNTNYYDVHFKTLYYRSLDTGAYNNSFGYAGRKYNRYVRK